MRNIFDQYSQPENQLTHALVSTLFHERKLLKPFMEWAGAKDIPPGQDMNIVEQQRPGTPISGDEDFASGSLPDACIYEESGWVLLIEAKAQAGFDADQIDRHRAMACRNGFPRPQMLAIVVDRTDAANYPGILVREWREIYQWFRRRSGQSFWTNNFADYLEIFESKKIAENYAIRGTLTMFDGFHFSDENPFHYREAKRLLRLLGDELRKRKELEALGIDLDAPGRKMITGSQGGAVWDYLQFTGAGGIDKFNQWPHLTFTVKPDGLGAMLNLPNSLKGGLKSRFKSIGEDNLYTVLKEVEKRIRPVLRRIPGSSASASVVQRHYPSRTAQPIVDAKISADLRTISSAPGGNVKHQPDWIKAIYDLIVNKRSNLQFGISASFPYETKIVQSAKVVDGFVGAWVAMKPMIEVALDEPG